MMRVLLVASLMLGGCVAAPVLSALPGVLASRAVDFLEGKNASIAMDMQRSLVAVQQGLDQMSLHVNVLEPVKEGYSVEFGNGELDGDVQLQRQTEKLTTLTVTAHRGLGREESVESAIVKQVLAAADKTTKDSRFDFDGYGKVYAKSRVQSTVIGWFLPGQKLTVSNTQKAGWLVIRLPSGRHGFIQGHMENTGK